MSLKLRLPVFAFALSAAVSAQAKEIKICTDNNYWYPFSYEENGVAKGVHIDLARKVLEGLGYQPKFEPLPWDRCLKEYGAKGTVDAIVSASYKPDRAAVLNYPPDAANEPAPCASKYKVMCVSYIVVSHVDAKVNFDGDVKKLPKPVRAPNGYSIVKDLEKEGVVVETTKSDVQNMRKLLRDKSGVVILTPQQAAKFQEDKEFAGKLFISDKAITEKSYHVIFSKKSSLTADEQKKIWDAVAKVSSDKKLMSEMMAKYSGDSK